MEGVGEGEKGGWGEIKGAGWRREGAKGGGGGPRSGFV